MQAYKNAGRNEIPVIIPYKGVWWFLINNFTQNSYI
jgi:hypothetical protein